MSHTPVTEMTNELTEALDMASPSGIVRLLRATDAQLFAGWGGFPGIHEPGPMAALLELAAAAAGALRRGEAGRIVLSGSGTSGRMAFLVARAFNAHLRASGRPAAFAYLCAGGDVALFSSREAPEDDWARGQERLAAEVTLAEAAAVAAGASAASARVVFVGITCGLSAPFVAGQLAYALERTDVVVPVLLGFSPTERARAHVIEGWDLSFRDVVARMEANPAAILLTPVVGPEAVTGSTRMKGGSATKLLLEVAFSLAWRAVDAAPTLAEEPATETTLTIDAARALFLQYEVGVRHAYYPCEALAVAVECVADALRAGGHVYYLARGVLGIEALIDASECPPTYNAAFDDVRAFLSGGYTALGNVEGDLAAQDEPDLQLRWRYFADAVVPTLTAADVLVVLDGFETPATAEDALLPAICRDAAARGTRIVACLVGTQAATTSFSQLVGGAPLAAEVCVPLPPALAALPQPAGNEFVAELAAKLLLNALTTGGFVLKGKVMRNRMIDLQVSNNKLFFRAIGIVSTFSGADEPSSRTALLRAIYGADDITVEIIDAPVSAHIARSAAASASGVRVVPTAIVLAARPTLSFAGAEKVLATYPIVRSAIAHLQ